MHSILNDVEDTTVFTKIGGPLGANATKYQRTLTIIILLKTLVDKIYM